MDRSHDAWLWVAGACLAVGVAFLGISAALVAAKPPTLATSHAHWTTTWEAYVAYCLFVVGGLCFVAGVTERRFPLIGRSQPPTPAPPSPAASSPPLSVTPKTAATEHSRAPIFDEAPPELADMSPASLQEFFAGRTVLQAETLLRQHVGKPVRVSGEVTRVDLGFSGEIPQAQVRSGGALLLLFSDDDTEAQFRALSTGDWIVASAEIHRISKDVVSLTSCKLIDVRGGGL